MDHSNVSVGGGKEREGDGDDRELSILAFGLVRLR